MKKYTLIIQENARKQLKKLPKDVSEKLRDVMEGLAENPRPNGYKKLKGEHLYCVRKGTYRIIYDIVEHKVIVIILSVGHRKHIYQNLP